MQKKCERKVGVKELNVASISYTMSNGNITQDRDLLLEV